MTAGDWADWIALGALLLSVLAIGISELSRRKDVARAEAADVRARVWAILSMEPGARAVLALDDGSDENRIERIKLLKRTVDLLRAAGASDVGKMLEGVLSQKWGDPPSEEAKQSRIDFIDYLTRFMTPTR